MKNSDLETLSEKYLDLKKQKKDIDTQMNEIQKELIEKIESSIEVSEEKQTYSMDSYSLEELNERLKNRYGDTKSIEIVANNKSRLYVVTLREKPEFTRFSRLIGDGDRKFSIKRTPYTVKDTFDFDWLREVDPDLYHSVVKVEVEAVEHYDIDEAGLNAYLARFPEALETLQLASIAGSARTKFTISEEKAE